MEAFPLSALEVILLAGGGVLAGVVNTLAGGGSLLTVPLLVLTGLPGTVANGSNRVGILVQSLVASGQFRSQGVLVAREAAPVLAPAVLGALVGAYGISQLSSDTFDRIFGVIMLLLLVPMLRGKLGRDAPARPWSPLASALIFFGIGLYGGAIQAGVGIFLVFALAHAGYDLVRANAIKMLLNVWLALAAIPVFWLENQIAWAPAAVLATGFAGGGLLGARLAVRGGERLIRPVLVVAVVALAGRMLGLY